MAPASGNQLAPIFLSPSLRPLRHSPRLPFEILNLIFQEVMLDPWVWPEEFYLDLDYNPYFKPSFLLARLCLVCLAWNHAGRPLLYSRIHMSCEGSLEETNPTDEFGAIVGEPEVSYNSAMLDSLHKHEHLRPLVREVLVTFPNRPRYESVHILPTLISNLIALCPRTHTLVIRNIPPGPSLNAVLEQLILLDIGKLRALGIAAGFGWYGIDMEGSRTISLLLELLKRQYKLKRLDLRDFEISDPPSFDPSSLPQLRGLFVDAVWQSYDVPLFKIITSNSTDSLTTLHVATRPRYKHPMSLNIFTNLQSLSWRVSLEGVAMRGIAEAGDFDKHFLHNLSNLPLLKNVDIDWRSPASIEDDTIFSSWLLSELPHSLEHLTISRLPLESLRAYVASDRCLRLRHIEIRFRFRGNRRKSSWDTWTPWSTIVIEKVMKEKGIGLSRVRSYGLERFREASLLDYES